MTVEYLLYIKYSAMIQIKCLLYVVHFEFFSDMCGPRPTLSMSLEAGKSLNEKIS